MRMKIGVMMMIPKMMIKRKAPNNGAFLTIQKKVN
jgi:hypothetical protein